MNPHLYRRIAAFLAISIATLGVALIAVTTWHGGGTSGYVIGAMFLALGSGRLYLLMRRR